MEAIKKDQKLELFVTQLNKINTQIDNIEKQYPFIVTTIIAVVSLISTILTNAKTENMDSKLFFNVLVILLPILSALVLCYILQLFRQVALLRGYAAYLEESINARCSTSVMIWNSKYIDGFIENNSPNLLTIFSSIIAAVCIVCYYIVSFLMGAKLKPQCKWFISIAFIFFLVVIAYQFAVNDKYRRVSYWRAKSENENVIRVFLFSECRKLISKSGVGQAVSLQATALKENGIYYTTKANEFYNVVHINTFGLKSFCLARKSRRKGIRVIITAHTIVEDFKDSFIFTYNKKIQELFRAWLKNFYKNADTIIAPTVYVKKLLQGETYNISVPIKVISNGVDTEIFSGKGTGIESRRETINYINNKSKKKEKICINDKLIISVGLYLERKGILNFIKLAEAMPEYKFVWYGHTSGFLIPSKIRKAIKEGKQLPNVYFPGYVEHDLLAKAYNAADLFLMLSYEETEGLVVLEALASNIQAIINDIDVYKDWLIDKRHCYKVHIDKNTDIIRDTNIIDLVNGLLEGRIKTTKDEGYKIAEERTLGIIGEKLCETYKE